MKLSPTEVHDDTKAKASSPRARDRHSVIRKKTTARHAAIAGAVAGGVAIMCEKKARGVFALQLFVRYVPQLPLLRILLPNFFFAFVVDCKEPTILPKYYMCPMEMFFYFALREYT
jgi:hypothetical protein